MLGNLGVDKAKVYRTIYSYIFELGYRVSCSCRCIIVSHKCYANIEYHKET